MWGLEITGPTGLRERSRGGGEGGGGAPPTPRRGPPARGGGGLRGGPNRGGGGGGPSGGARGGGGGAGGEEGHAATVMKNAGYATGLIGKWHLGYQAGPVPERARLRLLLRLPQRLVDYYQHTDGGKPDLFENDKPVRRRLHDRPDHRARDPVHRSERKQQPFFLEVAYNAAHWPFQVPDKPSVAPDNARFVQPHDEHTSTRADYAAMLERADQGVGRILSTLEKLGLTRNTLVIFTNDNGGEWLSRNAPLFHRKTTIWEGGIRVPWIGKGGARTAAGRPPG